MKKITQFLLMCFTIVVFGQTEKQVDWTEMGDVKNATFYEVQAAFNAFWKDKTLTKGKGYKPFKRWEDYMESRVYPSGNMNLTSLTYTNYMEWLKNNSVSEYISTTQRSAANWTELGPIGSPSGPSPYTRTGAGRLNFVRFDPTNSNVMYVGAPDGGLWKSTNSGASWSTNTDFLTLIGCSDLVIDPNNTNTMYLATGDVEGNSNSIGILKTTDGGVTWNTTSLAFPVSNSWRLSRLLMDPNNSLRMIVASNVGVWYTTDGWVTNSYSDVAGTNADLKDMEFKPGLTNANTVYAAGSQFFKSTDFGTTWTQISSGLPTTGVQRIALAVTAGNDAYVYALIGKSSDQSYMGTYRSTDSGATFTTMSTTPNLLGYTVDGSDAGGQAFYDLSIIASPTDPNNITVGGVNHWRSFDGGTTWENVSVWDSGEIHADVHEIVYESGSSTTMYSCNDGGLFKSTDNGNVWFDISNNLAIAQVVKLGLSATTESGIVAGEQDNGTNLKSGAAWDNIFGGDGGECFIDYTNNNTIYVQYVQGAYARSTNGGTTFTSITNGLPAGIDFYSPFKMDPVNNLRLYSGGTPTLYTSANQGTNWTALGASAGTGSIKDFAIAPSNTAIIYTVQNDAVSKSIDSGVTFTDVTGSLPTTAALKSITVSNTDPNKVWVVYSGYESGTKVYKSTDGGSSWVNISAGLPNLPMNTIVYTNGSSTDAIYVGGDVGVYYYDNTLSAFEPFLVGLPNCAVRDLEIFYSTNKLRAGTYGRGVWETNLNDGTLSVNQNEFENTVLIFENEREQLQVSSSNEEIKSIEVFDVLGRKVFEEIAINSKNYNITTVLRNQQVLFVNITLSSNRVVSKKIVF